MFHSKLYGENPSDQIPANNEGNKPSAEIPLTEECASNWAKSVYIHEK